jgi:hypothetical protein
MTTKELEALAGIKLGARVEFVLLGRRLFRRVDGGWEEYPPYPEPVAP